MPQTPAGPPPPPGPPPPAPPLFNVNSGKCKNGANDGHGMLLQSIRQGTNLKKTVTIDKSAPVIPGKAVNHNSGNTPETGRSGAIGNQSTTNGLDLATLFVGGVPKLRPTGRVTGGSQSSINIIGNNDLSKSARPSHEFLKLTTVSNSSSQLNDLLKKQIVSDFRNRGPPPKPPTHSTKNSFVPDSVVSPPNKIHIVNTSSNGTNLQKNPITSPPNQANNSFLHNVTNNSCSNVENNNLQIKSAVSHGKPNVAPKPPAITTNCKPATPLNKPTINGRATVTRAQSMRVPRSPPVTPPINPLFPPMINGKEFGSMRGIPVALHQSQENLTVKLSHSRNQTLPVNLNKNNAPQPPFINSRPSGPPPLRPLVPPPPSRTASNTSLKAPLSPPPPPPVTAPPPPPPHRTSPAPTASSHMRLPPSIPSIGPPPPPVRNSSMRNGSPNNVSPCFDMDARFSNLFHSLSDFPEPPIYQGLHKIYGNKNGLNKQQAPLPPNSIHLGKKLWDSSTC